MIVHLPESKPSGSRTPCAWFSFPAIYSRLPRASENMSSVWDQYTLIPPNFSLMRRASAAYPNQKPPARAMHRVVIQSQAWESPCRLCPKSLEPPGAAAATDKGAVPASEVRDAGDPAGGWKYPAGLA